VRIPAAVFASNIQILVQTCAGREKIAMLIEVPTGAEKFSEADLTGLREELLHANLDSWQAADVISHYLVTRGYGVSAPAARSSASRLESTGYSVERMKEEFEKLAMVA
jgi:hypothetical protein